jgi:hypothetical protein
MRPKIIPQMHPTLGRLLTNKEIQDKEDEYKTSMLYPQNLVLEHRTENGKEEVKLNLT